MQAVYFESLVRAVYEAYTLAPEANIGIDYAELSHAIATGGTASVPTVTHNTMTRLITRGWLEEAQEVINGAIPDARQARAYMALVIAGSAPNTIRDQVTMRYGRTAIESYLRTTHNISGLTCAIT